jgi:hypothetical protein
MLTCLQILNQVEPIEETNVEPIERAINQLVVEDQKNLEFELTFRGQNVIFKGG